MRTIGSADERHLKISARYAAALACAIGLSGCSVGDGSISFTEDRGVADQPFPTNYRTELLSFLKTYLNNPVGVRDAAMAEPVQRTIGGRLRYVSCLRYNERNIDGSYRGAVERAVVYVDARLDRVIDNAAEACAGATYAPFPDMEKMTR